MSLLSPTPLDVSRRLTAVVPHTFEYTDPVTNIRLTRSASVLYLSEEYKKTIDECVIAVDIHAFTQEQLIRYVAMQNLILACASTAEDIKSRFLEIIIKLWEQSPKFPKDRLKAIQERKVLMKLDFMSLKDQFMEHLKSDLLLKQIEDYSSNGKLKPFRRALDRFVVDRNTYTHGRLLCLHSTNEFVIEYIDNKTRQIAYSFITYDIITSYNNLYKEILKLLDTYQATRTGSTYQEGTYTATLRLPGHL